MKDKNKVYKEACYVSLSLMTIFQYNGTSEKYRDSLVQSERLAKS